MERSGGTDLLSASLEDWAFTVVCGNHGTLLSGDSR
jgi:hypothetical protein